MAQRRQNGGAAPQLHPKHPLHLHADPACYPLLITTPLVLVALQSVIPGGVVAGAPLALDADFDDNDVPVTFLVCASVKPVLLHTCAGLLQYLWH